MKRIFERGDLVTLTCPDYKDIRKGTMGIVVEPVNERRFLMNVWIDGQSWSFPEHEFVHSHLYKETACTQ
jgi:hypothetical protein